MDHMSFLGNTLEEIAQKKAGIIKPGCRTVTTRQESEAIKVITKTCEQLGVSCTIADPDEAVLEQESVFGQSFTYEGQKFDISLREFTRRRTRCWLLRHLKFWMSWDGILPWNSERMDFPIQVEGKDLQ